MVLVSNRPSSNPRAGDEYHLPDPDRRRPRRRTARQFRDAPFSGRIGFSDSPDGGLGIIMSALAGIAAALAVAIVLSVYFRSSYRSRHDLLKHGLAASAVLVLVAFAISDMRQAALAYLGLNPAKPAVEFEIRLPKAALTTAADTQVELLTDRNQKLAKVQEALASTDDGRSLLRGTVTLDYRTTERMIVLNLPGRAKARSGCGCPRARRAPASSGRGIWPTASSPSTAAR